MAKTTNTRAPAYRRLKRERRRTSDGFGVSKSNVQGNLIATNAKVGNMRRHILDASTRDMPYFVSTMSRFNALSKMRPKIVSDMVDRMKPLTAKGISNLADQIRPEETKNLEKLASSLSLGSAGNLINMFNSIGNEANSLEKLMNTTIQQLYTAYYRFIDKDFSSELVDQFAEAAFIEEDYSNNLIGDRYYEGKINFRESQGLILQDFSSNLSSFLQSLNKSSIKIDDFSTIERSLSYITSTLVKAKGKVEAQGITDKEFLSLMEEVQSIKNKFNNQLGGQMKYSSNMFGQGLVAEFFVASWLESTLAEQVKANKNNNKNFKDLAKKANDNVEDIIVSLVSGKRDIQNKSADMVVEYGDSMISADIKQFGVKRLQNLADLTGSSEAHLYSTSMTVNFGPTFNREVAQDASEVARLYRSFVLNDMINQGYILKPEEREAFAKAALMDNFDHKFKSLKGSKKGYPEIVIVNGRFFRFSEVIYGLSQTGDGSYFKVNSEKAGYTLGAPEQIKAPIGLYRKKVQVGKGRRVKGFSEKLGSDMSNIVKNAEDSYFSKSGKITYTFKI